MVKQLVFFDSLSQNINMKLPFYTVLIQYNSVFIFKLQIEFVPFKIVPFRGYTYSQNLLAIQRKQFAVCQENFQVCGMLKTKTQHYKTIL
jgi:hypothetical protein